MNNVKLRIALIKHNMKQYELADLLSVSESKVSKMLRSELPEKEQNRIVKLIEGGSDNGK